MKLLMPCMGGLLMFLTPLSAWAWGEDGHIIVAKIAEVHLTPAARAGVKDLLGEQAISDLRVCTWSDLIRSSAMYKRKFPKNDTWHYINIELKVKAEEFKPAEDNDHVIGAIERFQKVLADSAADKEERKYALMFLVHFLGDMHQPLHCGNREDDRGGNLQPIKSFLGKNEAKLNLHKVWDSHLVHAERGNLTNDDFVKRLLDEIKEEDRALWQKEDVRKWVWESHMIVVERVYKINNDKDFPKRDEAALELTEENYVKGNKPIVRAQLKKGGIRLAKVLNDCFEVKK